MDRSASMNFKLSFQGAAGTVTGSRHLLSAGKHDILVDAGMFQGLKELRLLNWRRPDFDPQSVDDIILTHAHLDHCGALPRLVREGFRGTIHCTPPTRELAEIILLDSAKLQEEDAEYANRKGFSKHKPALPLYNTDDVTRTMRRMRTHDYHEPFDLDGGISVEFFDAGHILGAAFARVRIEIGGRDTTVVFSGDVGRYNVPLHNDPEPMPPCDALVVESTYGNRTHDPTPMIDQIRRPFRDTLRRGGVVLIPAFAVARAQLITLMIRELMESGEIPEIPVHIDSPMAARVTAVYRRSAGTKYLDASLTDDEWQRLFPKDVQFCSSVEESKQLNRLQGPRVIIAASGMLTGGRVLHHLERLGPSEKNLIVLAGYQAAGTRGRALVDGARTLRMHGADIPIRAEIMSLLGLSAHADANELVRWVQSAGVTQKALFIVHGEPDASAALAQRLHSELQLQTFVPKMGEVFDLSTLLSA
jgi:metallo-beta-lactamase family protein